MNRNPYQQNNGGPDQSGQTMQPFTRSWVFWLLVIVGIVALVYTFWPSGEDRATVSYSALRDAVTAGNVEEVTVRGSEVQGIFSESLRVANGRIFGPDESLPSGISTENVRQTTQFESTIPEGGQSDFLELVQNQENIIVNAEQPSDGFNWLLIALLGLPFLLILGFLLMMNRAAGSGQQRIFDFTKSKARVADQSRPTTKFEDFAGEDQAKRELMQVVDFLKNPTKFHKLGAALPRGTLLVGPPGTGKTLLARAVAGEAGVPFFSVSASEFVEMFVGVGAGRVRDLFKNAKEASPAIIFIDELDAIGRQRFAGVGTGNDEREQTLNQILDEMDGFEAHDDVLVIAATNRPDVLDPALMRPGRFDRQVTLGLPDRRARRRILDVHIAGVAKGGNLDLDEIAQSTPGFSGADLANLVNEAALVAATKDKKAIEQDDFSEALERIMLGAERPMVLGDYEKRLIAYHETGHAVVSHFTPGSDPVRMISIIPRGQSLGATVQSPSDDRFNYTRGYLIGRLAGLMGGRASEWLNMHEMTTGAQNDLKQATQLARRMVGLWGMSDQIGPYYLGLDEEHVFLGREMGQERSLSSELLDRAEHVAQDLVSEAMDVATNTLREHQAEVDQLVERLIEEESLSSEQIGQILGPPSELPQQRPAGAFSDGTEVAE